MLDFRELPSDGIKFEQLIRELLIRSGFESIEECRAGLRVRQIAPRRLPCSRSLLSHLQWYLRTYGGANLGIDGRVGRLGTREGVSGDGGGTQ